MAKVCITIGIKTYEEQNKLDKKQDADNDGQNPKDQMGGEVRVPLVI